jgi:hypothetical protein
VKRAFILPIRFITHQVPKGLRVDDAVILGTANAKAGDVTAAKSKEGMGVDLQEGVNV